MIGDEVKAMMVYLETRLAASYVSRWNVEIACRSRRAAKKKGEGDEMKYGVNLSVAYLGTGAVVAAADYPYEKHYTIKRSDALDEVWVVQSGSKSTAADTDTPATAPVVSLDGILHGARLLETEITERAPFPLVLKAITEGHIYSIGGDWIIRVGSCRKGNTYRGIVLEIEYTPCVRVRDGLLMIAALLPTIDYKGAMRQAGSVPWKTSEELYTSRHMAIQWSQLLDGMFAS